MYTRRLTLIFLFVPLLMVYACASYPRVTYLSLPNKDADGAIKYYLQGSLVTLGVEPENKGKEDAKNGVSAEFLKTKISLSNVNEIRQNDVRAIVTPTESKNHLYAIKPHESVWSKTSVSVSYVDNTRLIKSIGTNFEDNRIKVIQSTGEIVASMIPMIGGLPKAVKKLDRKKYKKVPPQKEQLNLPVVIDLSETGELKESDWLKIPGYDQWWYKLDLSAQPPDSRESSKYFKKIDGAKKVRSLAYSSCQDAKLLVTHSTTNPNADTREEGTPDKAKEVATFNIRIANPNYVSTLNFPAKGSIAMHSICGADIKTEESKTISNLDIMEALIKQVEAIQKVQAGK